MMKIKGLCYLFILTCTILQITDGEVCFRKYVPKKNACRGMMRKQYSSPLKCCNRRKASGYAIREIKHGKKFYKCTPCSVLNARMGNEIPPPTRSGWSDWTPWSRCSRTCEAGFQERTRVCNGEMCEGDTKEIQPCSMRSYCPVNGKWGPWYPWEKCSVSCGGGIQIRRRQCSDPPPTYGGKNCKGSSIQNKECNQRSCPVDGQWGDWTPYSACSVTCGPGVQVRTRECDNPMPAGGGKWCSGKYTNKQKCFDKACPVDGGWSLWSNWSPCSVSCGEGKIYRTRECDSPAPRFGGKLCQGAASEHEMCRVRRPCPVNGGWSEWTEWGNCYAKPCSGEKGYKIRSRSCTEPKPQYGGRLCRGSLLERQDCYNNDTCPRDGGWCEWKNLGACSRTCGQGLQRQERRCQCPEPVNGGKECAGNEFALSNCTTNVNCTETETGNKGEGCGSGSGSGSGDGSPDGSNINCDQEKDDEGDDLPDNLPAVSSYIEESPYLDDIPANIK